MEKRIHSSDNPVFRGLRDCLSSKGIKKHKQFMIFGERAVRDVLKTAAGNVRNLLLCEDQSPAFSLSKDLSVIHLSKELFAELDVFGTRAPILVLNAPELPEVDLTKPPTGIEILVALSEPSNLGALIRTAAAFGASRLVLLKESASPFHPKSVRAASAATLATPLARGPSIQDLQAEGCVALDLRGAPLPDFKWPKNVRLLIGEEGKGVPDLPMTRVSIPMNPAVESLNATIAASIALYAYRSNWKI